MKKRIIAIIALAALIIGLLAGIIPAVSAAESDRFTVGYSKKDLTPWVQSAYTGGLGVVDKETYTDNKIVTVQITDPANSAKTVSQKMVSVPLAGYNSSDTRYSTKIMDDNNDGKIGIGDGVFVTATSVTDSYGTTVIYISLDAVAAFDYIVSDTKSKIVDQVRKLGGTISADRIMISASHSHTAPDMDRIHAVKTSGSALEAYYNYYVDQVVAAATEAYQTGSKAAMSKGQADSEDAVPYKLNSVRHYYRYNGYNGKKAFVGSNEFNSILELAYRGENLEPQPYNSGTMTSGVVADSNDTMYILRFTPENQNEKPILLINWRAHPGFVGAKDKLILSSDYINSMRTKLENADYRVSFIQGASGNINPTSLYSDENSVNAIAGYGTAEGIYRSQIYGGLLADVAIYCLNPSNRCMTGELEAGRIRTRQITYKAEKEYQDGQLNLPLNAIALGKYVTFVSAPGELFDRYDANYATNYNVTYQKHSRTGNWSTGYKDIWTVTKVDPKNPPVFAEKDILPTYENIKAYTTNDWDNLVSDVYGTPFVLGYTDARAGYFPNTMAYDYNDNVTTPIVLANGGTMEFQKHSYEASGAGVIAQGEGENIIKKYAQMLAVVSDEGMEKVCQHCGTKQLWEPLTKETGALRTLGTGHYYLAENITGVSAQMKTIQGDVCLDLNGKILETDHANNGTSFVLSTDATLSIIDETNQGAVIGHASSGYKHGAVVPLLYRSNATLNLYGGTLKAAQSTNVSLEKGGVISINDGCTFNMYGGTVEGSNALWGGAVYIYGSDGFGGTRLNVSGGKITSGTATNAGDCVYIINNANAKVYLSGNAEVDEIYCDFGNSGAVYTDQVNLNGSFTGKASLQFSDKFKFREGQSYIGAVSNGVALAHKAISYTAADGQVYYGAVIDNKTYLTKEQKYVIIGVDGTAHTVIANKGSISEALIVYNAGGTTPETATQYIKLGEDVTKNIVISKDVYLDLNGHQITGNITVERGKTLYCMDSRTDDYDIEDGNGYAVITGTVTGNIQGVPAGSPISPDENRGAGHSAYHAGYLKIVEKVGGVTQTSFHRVDLGLVYINFKPDDLGMSYTSNFSGDQLVKKHVKGFGVAVSIQESPNAENLETKCGYSTLEGFEAGRGVNVGKSTRLINIMLPTNSHITNKNNSEKKVYGKAYLLTDEGYTFGTEAVKTLKETVEAADTYFAQSNETLQQNAVNMYETFEKVMSKWNVENIKAAANKEEDETLKILVLGNSHGVDSSTMLAKIYMAEKPEQDVLVGRIYHSGCKLNQHVDFLTNDAGQYIYYKTNANGAWDRIKPLDNSAEQPNGDVLNGATMYEALTDEKWDVIIMQTGSNNAGLADTYNGDIQTIQTYVKQILGYTPKFYWHMSWAHPVEDDPNDNFTTVNTSSQFRDYYNNDQMTMYNAIVNAVKTKILPDKSFSGIMPTGTAIQNANSSYLRDADLYRDYTHASDLGRLIAGYTWYCAIEGVRLDSIKLTNIPQSVLKSYITAGGTGNMVLTEKEAAIVAESVKNALNNPFAVTQSVYTTK